MQIAIFGLGRMGMQIAKRLHKNDFEVLAWNRSEAPREEFEKFITDQSTSPLIPPLARGGEGGVGSKIFANITDTVLALTGQPRIFWLMLPHNIIDDFLNDLGPHFKEGDIVIDGGNSFYKDSIRRAEQLSKKGIHYFDCGTSGGVWGEENGFALMVGGPVDQWRHIEPIMKTLSGGDNYGLVGKNGAGHFVKMVHNGVEYGMMEAIAEGYSVLEASPFKLDLAQVTKIYQQGSVVRSWLVDLMADIFAKENISATNGIVKATGEGEWTVKTAEELGLDVRVIRDALEVRRESEIPENQNLFRNKILALLRKQFGGHGIEKKE